MEKIKHGKWGT